MRSHCHGTAFHGRLDIHLRWANWNSLSPVAQLLGQLGGPPSAKSSPGSRCPAAEYHTDPGTSPSVRCASAAAIRPLPPRSRAGKTWLARMRVAVAVHERARLDLARQRSVLPPQGEAFICRIRQAVFPPRKSKAERSQRSLGKCKTPEQESLLRREFTPVMRLNATVVTTPPQTCLSTIPAHSHVNLHVLYFVFRICRPILKKAAARLGHRAAVYIYKCQTRSQSRFALRPLRI